MKRGIVVAAQPEAAEAGALMLMAGGNAFDAGIACALTQGVVDPLMTGLGGVGSAVVHVPARGLLENLNFLGAAPAGAREDMWADRIRGETGDGFGFVVEGRVNALGHQAVMVPGNLAGYHTIHSEHGKLPWATVCEPAIAFAREGWIVRPHVHAYATQDEAAQGRVPNAEILGYTEAGRALYLGADGQMRRPGSTIRNPDLAATLEIIAADGADALYRGVLGERLAADMAAHGGLVTTDDLAAFEVTRQPALTGSYRGHRIATNRPGGSGVQLLQTLATLDHFDLPALGHGSAEHIRVVAEAIARAYGDKRAHVGDPRFVTVPLDDLLDPARIAAYAAAIGAGERARLDRLPAVGEVRGTTQVCALDTDGNALSMTHTLGAPSGVIVPGSGFLLNGCMGIFDPRPGRATSIAPGKGYTSSMSPAIVFDAAGGTRLVIGAPGGTYIPQAIAQAISNVLAFDMTVLEAVSAPRVAVTRSETIDVSNRVPRFVSRALEAMGYAVQRSFASYAFAGVHGIEVTAGGVRGAADPGRDGMALAV
ncbi:MAG: gamma-glutamyltransferase family protein [Ectothiorhodospiraceae bacterium]|nr:gamma-glutamyltransferase family protein [Chromatiales bacterium]MCP5156519.1 gamma-glutamyltransferase family protein [Ectothiorhodospiraceae bacterium]